MSENQNIEYKENWRDEYLKWICGFANANGGSIYIGIDDNGNVVGINNAKQLLEEIPNKVKDILGILVNVNLHINTNKEYIEIIIEPYPNPINYRGQYYFRSGSTKQELKGASLDKFLLKKIGKRWDSVSISNVLFSDFKTETINFYKKRAIKSQRITDDVLNDTNENLIENLQLTEDNYYKRAAILLFHPNPEKYITGAYIKVGYFETDDDLKFQDEIHGNIIEQIEKTIDLLFTKYIKAIISYEAINRIEKYEYPKEAIREALLNAVSHKDYSGGTPIQISVYPNKLIFWNEGQLPENWTIANLLVKHPSKPYNPDIANALFRCGYIESWGRGTVKMINECIQYGIPKPIYYYNMSGFWVEFEKDLFSKVYLNKLGLNERQVKAVLFTKEHSEISNKIYQDINQISKRTATNELSELAEKYELLVKIGSHGASIIYKLIIGQ